MAFSAKLYHSPLHSILVKSPTNHFRCVRYAMNTLLRVLPALGNANEHLHPPSGLSFRHFVIAGVICAALLVSSLVLFVTLLLGFIVAPRAA